MSKDESPATRYRRLAEESLKLAKTFPPGKERDASLQMAQCVAAIERSIHKQYVAIVSGGCKRAARPAAATTNPTYRRR
jgi:hypothetical protein